MSAKYPERFGLSLVFSPVNSAWFLMWKDQVIRIISDEKEAAAEYSSSIHETFCKVLGQYIWCREWHDGMSSPEYAEACELRLQLAPWEHLLTERSDSLLIAYPLAEKAYNERHEEKFGGPVK